MKDFTTIQQFKELIIAFYNLKKHVMKLVSENKLEDKIRPITSGFSKIDNVLKMFGYEVIDYTNQKYNDGMNVEIVSTTKSKNGTNTIKETIEPSIIFKGELINKAKVIKEISEEENA